MSRKTFLVYERALVVFKYFIKTLEPLNTIVQAILSGIESFQWKISNLLFLGLIMHLH